MTSRQHSLMVAALTSMSLGWIVLGASTTAVSAIRTSSEARAAYLAHAIIWRDPGTLSPTDLLEGPAGAFPYTSKQATSDEGIACTFVQAGRGLGGATPKFLCRTADGQNLRVKYWDPQTRTGNREVFSTVAGSRLMWALGFNAVPALPINVRCDGCPQNPHEGTGSPRTRRYIAMVQARWQTPAILSNGSIDQGWSWRELDTAIGSLPPGTERARQRTHFDALTLLGVVIQHGDRKSEQQRLYCAGPVDTAAGELQAVKAATAASPVLLERPGVSACRTSAVAIEDIGATFGGAGRESRESTAKMNLDEWKRKRVFAGTNDGGCRGDLIVSFRASHDGEPNPVISEDGRRFLIAQLGRLTPDHVRAIFTAARVDHLLSRDAPAVRDRGGAIDAWVAAFQDKVRQIEARRCR